MSRMTSSYAARVSGRQRALAAAAPAGPRRRERSGEELTPEMMIIGATLGILMLALVAWLI